MQGGDSSAGFARPASRRVPAKVRSLRSQLPRGNGGEVHSPSARALRNLAGEVAPRAEGAVEAPSEESLRRRWAFFNSLLASEVGLRDLWPPEEVNPTPGEQDLAAFHEVSHLSQLKRQEGVLLDQEQSHTLGPNPLEDREDLIHPLGGQSKGGFIQKEEGRLPHQGPGDREHLLFAAGKSSAPLAEPVAEGREKDEAFIEALMDQDSIPAEVAPHEEILLHREGREDPPPLRDEAEAAARDRRWGEAVNPFPCKPNRPAQRVQEAGDCPQGRALSRAVRANKGHCCPASNSEAHPTEDRRASVPRVQSFHLEERVSHRDACAQGRPSGPQDPAG